MSKRARIRARLDMLAEIGLIMGAMRNIALMETHKLARFLEHQHRVLAGIEEAAADFLTDHPEFCERDPGTASPGIIIAIGTQRGFCGDFNDVVARALRSLLCEPGNAHTRAVVVGRRLAAKLVGEPCVVAVFDAPSLADEVQGTLQRVLAAVGDMRLEAPYARLAPRAVLAHRDLVDAPVLRSIAPVPDTGGTRGRHAHPARLNVAPSQFHAGLMRHYLWAQVHDAFYGSLMAECRKRLRHLEGAMQRMRNREEDLRRRYMLLRQQEIIEEIEVILLSNEALKPRSRAPSAVHAMSGADDQ